LRTLSEPPCADWFLPALLFITFPPVIVRLTRYNTVT
jgi:hypothetical protein